MSALESYSSSFETYVAICLLGHYSQKIYCRVDGKSISDDDFFIQTWKTEPWASIWSKVESTLGLTHHIPDETIERLRFIVSTKKIPFMPVGVGAWEYRLFFRAAVECSFSLFMPKEDNFAKLLRRARTALANEKMPDSLPGWEEDIDEMSGSDFNSMAYCKIVNAVTKHLKANPSRNEYKWFWESISDFDIIKAVNKRNLVQGPV